MAARKSCRWVNLSYFEERLTGRWSLSFWQWLFCAPLAVYSSHDRIAKLSGLTDSEALVISFLIIPFSALSYFIASEFILKSRHTTPQSFERIFIAYVFISVFTSFLEMAGSALLFDQTPLIGTQFLTPIFPNFVVLVATATLISELSDSNLRLKKVSTLGEELTLNDRAINAELEKEKNQLVAGIENFLIPQLNKVRQALESAKLSSSREEKLAAIEAIEEFANKSVRTFSHEIYEKEISNFEPPKALAEKRARIASEIYQPYISIKLVIVFGVLIGGSQNLSLNGIEGLLYNVIAISIITLIGIISNSIMKVISKSFIEVKYLAFIFHLFLVGLTSAIFFSYLQDEIFNLEFKYDTGQVVYRNVINVLVSSAIVTLVEGRKELASRAELLNVQIQSQLVSRRRLLLDIRERVASIIHGQIQGRLSGIALALRLQDPIATDLEKEEEISNLLALVEKELRSILQTVHHENELTFVSGIEEIRREWESIVNIDVQIQLESEFNPSQNVIRNVRLALNEAISNAVRHGRAKNIEIVIKRYKHTKENLHLSISNDGQPLADAREPGLGFRNLDATTADWKISNTESGQVCVEAII
jgi:signal transduction histidine kinase